MTNELPRGKVTIYGAGGCGLNLVSRYSDMAGKEVPGVALVEPYFVDSSMANLKEGIDKERLFVLPETEGSGMVRTENREDIQRSVTPVLQNFKPGDLSIVVFGAGGGTGSVFGPYIIAKLLEQNKPVVAVVVGSDDCEKAASNTLNTVKSLEGVAQKSGKTVMMYYEHLKPTDKRSSVDNRVWMVISSLLTLYSRRNRALDLQDLSNFLNFSAVTSSKPQLSALEVFTKLAEAESTGDYAIAVANLLPTPDSESISFRPEYLCNGYPENPLPDKVESLHFVASTEPVYAMFKSLTKSTEEISRSKNARTEHEKISVNADADGMCF